MLFQIMVMFVYVSTFRIASANASKEGGGDESDEASKDDDWTNDKKCRSCDVTSKPAMH